MPHRLVAAAALMLTAAAPFQAGYRYTIPNPVMPQSYYAWLSGHNLPIEQCNAIGNSPRMSALAENIKRLNDGSTFGAMRAVIVMNEAATVLMRQCEQTQEAQQQLDYFTQGRATAVQNCQQLASSPSACLAPYPWQ